jgi:DegV family protein with EDD domain
MDKQQNIKQTVSVMTDSVAQVPPEIAKQLDISVIPFIVNIEGQQYIDGIDLVPSVLYRRMRNEKIMPTTSAPSLGKYQEMFHDRVCAGAQAVLCITLSSKLSSAYDTACLAAEQVRADYPDRMVEVLDSKSAAMSEGFIAIAAARAAADGKPLPEVLQVAREAGRRAGLVAALDTLEYLARGGRIGKLTFMAGSLIKIKPVLEIDDEGALTPINKVRSDDQALQTIVDHVAKQIGGDQRISLAILEADAPLQAARLEELAQQQLQPVKIFHSELTPVMGVHAGPGLVGLAYYYEHW